MADKEHLDRLKEGIGSWNRWREENPDVQPDLSNANLAKADLVEANFSKADITGANFAEANLSGANFSNLIPHLNSASSRSLVRLGGFLLLTRILSGLLVGAAGLSVIKYFAADLKLQGVIVIFSLVASYLIFLLRGLTRGSLNIIILLWLISSFGGGIVASEVFIYAFTCLFLIVLDGAIIDIPIKLHFFTRILTWNIGIFSLYIQIIDITYVPFSFSKEYLFLGIPFAEVFLTLNFYIAYYKILNDEDLSLYIKAIGLSFSSFGTINFRQANLINANFFGSNILYANLENAILDGVCFYDVKNLETAKLDGTILADPNIQKLLVSRGQGEGKNYRGKNLKGAYLVEANLSGADLSEVDISGANLSMANLSGANLSSSDLSNANFKGANLSETVLVATQALGTNFSEATLTGACIEDWNINSATKLNDIDCQYIYLKSDKQERCPSSGEFAPGEFTKLFQKALETVDLMFKNGIDWEAFAYSFRKIQVENEGSELAIQSIEAKGDGVVVVRVNVSPNADKAKIHSDFIQGYEFAHKVLEDRYRAELSGKNTQIVHYSEEVQRQGEYINNLFNLLSQQQTVQKAMADNLKKVSNTNFYNPQFAGGFVDANTVDAHQIGGNIANYTPEQRHTLAEAAAEIQQLLNQLAQTNPTTDVVTEAIHQEIKHNPTFKSKLLAALKAGGLEALKAIFNHPAFSIPAETIKGYLEAE